MLCLEGSIGWGLGYTIECIEWGERRGFSLGLGLFRGDWEEKVI